jgi:hypothetical protein
MQYHSNTRNPGPFIKQLLKHYLALLVNAQQALDITEHQLAFLCGYSAFEYGVSQIFLKHTSIQSSIPAIVSLVSRLVVMRTRIASIARSLARARTYMYDQLQSLDIRKLARYKIKELAIECHNSRSLIGGAGLEFLQVLSNAPTSKCSLDLRCALVLFLQCNKWRRIERCIVSVQPTATEMIVVVHSIQQYHGSWLLRFGSCAGSPSLVPINTNNLMPSWSWPCAWIAFGL